ncbi:4Fe-4S binding protein [Neobacillus sp. PS3-40]|uniref:indolepyruvate ferredoxin oxidoreductase subunit alpha n=1 Tax=Neobacillus sp. PS3-40 TaxID=3070679 RepID=UPI0027E076AF|nr:4Fe-4S binding protein [Neobacillus sp. PS3-40]WML43163.1 4Fe-4S binding protein [Neobacillus sp. PS3-40]
MEMKVIFNEEICKSCGLCVQVCPTNIIFLADYLNGKGYRPAAVVDQDNCISCAKCGQICPDSVITVYRPEKKKQMV